MIKSELVKLLSLMPDDLPVVIAADSVVDITGVHVRMGPGGKQIELLPDEELLIERAPASLLDYDEEALLFGDPAGDDDEGEWR